MANDEAVSPGFAASMALRWHNRHMPPLACSGSKSVAVRVALVRVAATRACASTCELFWCVATTGLVRSCGWSPWHMSTHDALANSGAERSGAGQAPPGSMGTSPPPRVCLLTFATPPVMPAKVVV